jgi:hypothetical protein
LRPWTSLVAVVAAAVLVAALLLAAPAGADPVPGAATKLSVATSTPPIKDTSVLVVRPPRSTQKIEGFVSTPKKVFDRAKVDRRVRRALRKHPDAAPRLFTRGNGWQVSWFLKKPDREIVQVSLDDASATVQSVYTSWQIAWPMARGAPDGFGRALNHPWIWLPLCALFVLPFLRPPYGALHATLAVLLMLSFSLWAFNKGDIGKSTPIAAFVLAFVMIRMLVLGLRRRDARADPPQLRLLLPVSALAVIALFLVGLRVGLNLQDSRVIDVGEASVIGGDHLRKGEQVYANFPKRIERGDTYGPVMYAAYAPFAAIHGQAKDDRGGVKAAHWAAIAWDLGVALLLLFVGMRLRGPPLGVLLAYLWLAFPFSAYALETNSNDALVGLLTLGAVAVAVVPARAGALAALGGLTKIATLVIVPLLLAHGRVHPWRSRQLTIAVLAFAVTAGVACLVLFAHGQGPATLYDRTIGYQADRIAPFSVWGFYDLRGLEKLWQVGVVILALGLAVAPRRMDLVGTAACSAAIIIAAQLSTQYWLYPYVTWFIPLVLLAEVGRFAVPVASGSWPSTSPASARTTPHP